jgi:hypothetical protein
MGSGGAFNGPPGVPWGEFPLIHRVRILAAAGRGQLSLQRELGVKTRFSDHGVDSGIGARGSAMGRRGWVGLRWAGSARLAPRSVGLWTAGDSRARATNRPLCENGWKTGIRSLEEGEIGSGLRGLRRSAQRFRRLGRALGPGEEWSLHLCCHPASWAGEGGASHP